MHLLAIVVICGNSWEIPLSGDAKSWMNSEGWYALLTNSLLGWVAESPVDSLWEFFPSLVGSICPLCARIFGLTPSSSFFSSLSPHCMGPNHERDFCSILVGASYPKLLLVAEALKSGWTVEARSFSSWIRIMKSIGIPVYCRVRWGTIETILN